jgi:hypothetical protein
MEAFFVYKFTPSAKHMKVKEKKIRNEKKNTVTHSLRNLPDIMLHNNIYQWPVPLPPRGFRSTAQKQGWPGSRYGGKFTYYA